MGAAQRGEPGCSGHAAFAAAPTCAEGGGTTTRSPPHAVGFPFPLEAANQQGHGLQRFVFRFGGSLKGI